MGEMELDETLEVIKNNFSNNQKKLFKRIKPDTNRQVAIGLISLQGVEKTSQAEIEVIASLISQFSPLEIDNFQNSPRRITLKGQFPNGHIVYIEPQYKVGNINPKAQPWAIDLVLRLNRWIGQDLVEIAAIGIEYDGHIAHYVESKIKSTYKRDAIITSNEGFQSLRISPEQWKSSKEDLKKAIKKYFEHHIKKIEKVQLSTINAQDFNKLIYENENENEVISTVTCPLCNGRGSLAGEDCPICNGMGSVKRYIAAKVNLSNYEKFTCPDCRSIKLDCKTCNDEGSISREKALEM